MYMIKYENIKGINEMTKLAYAKIGDVIKVKYNNRKYRVVKRAGEVNVVVVGIQKNTNDHLKGFNGNTEIEIIK